MTQYSINRNNIVIRNKLLDSLNPILQFNSNTHPFCPRTQPHHIIQPPYRTSISRNSYIQVEEKLNQQKADQFEVSQEEKMKTERKSRRKYLKVMSNSQELRSTSSRKGDQNSKNKHISKGSYTFPHQKLKMVSWPNVVPSSKIVNIQEKCQNIHKQFNVSAKTAFSSMYALPKTSSLDFQHEQSLTSKGPSLKQDGKQQSIQLPEESKIRILEELSKEDEVEKPKLTKNQYIDFSTESNSSQISHNNSYNLLRSQSINQFGFKSQLTRPNFTRIPLNNEQPIIHVLPHQFIETQGEKEMRDKLRKGRGKQNNFVFLDTTNIRNKMVFQVLNK